MARYFFHLCDGSETLLDPDGREVADKSSLRDLAIKDARAIISHDALTGSIRLDLRIEVRDSNGEVMCEVPFRDAITTNP